MIVQCATSSFFEGKASCRAGSNIAFIKYWGVADAATSVASGQRPVVDEDLNIPLNNSISMTLADAHTTTTVAWDSSSNLPTDTICIDGAKLQGAAAERIVAHLDRLRALAGVSHKARVVSNNNFPMAAGIASSASGFAALTVAASAALGLQLDATNSPPSPGKRVVRPAAACSEALSNGSGAGKKERVKRREGERRGVTSQPSLHISRFSQRGPPDAR